MLAEITILQIAPYVFLSGESSIWEPLILHVSFRIHWVTGRNAGPAPDERLPSFSKRSKLKVSYTNEAPWASFRAVWLGGGCPGSLRLTPVRVFRPAPGHLIRSTMCFCVREADSCLQQRFHGGAETHSLLEPRARRPISASGYTRTRKVVMFFYVSLFCARIKTKQDSTL